MLIKKIDEIKNDIIFEQINFNKKSFIYFLTDFKRSEKYGSSVIWFLFVIVIMSLSILTLPKNQASWLLLFYINTPMFFLFILAQYQEWIKCYLIMNDEILFGYIVGEKCFFPVKREIVNIINIRVLKDFCMYIFTFNHGKITYSLAYNNEDFRYAEVEEMLKSHPDLIAKFYKEVNSR